MVKKKTIKNKMLLPKVVFFKKVHFLMKFSDKCLHKHKNVPTMFFLLSYKDETVKV